jgi:hypothetical protein
MPRAYRARVTAASTAYSWLNAGRHEPRTATVRDALFVVTVT